jgi:hypothetical protein
MKIYNHLKKKSVKILKNNGIIPIRRNEKQKKINLKLIITQVAPRGGV